jgi:hypothetical protein
LRRQRAARARTRHVQTAARVGWIALRGRRGGRGGRTCVAKCKAVACVMSLGSFGSAPLERGASEVRWDECRDINADANKCCEYGWVHHLAISNCSACRLPHSAATCSAVLPSNVAFATSKVSEYVTCDAREKRRGGGEGGLGAGWGRGAHLRSHICFLLQQQSSGGVPLALAGEVKEWPVSFKSRIGADVLQSSSKRHGVITTRGSSGRCAGKIGMRGHGRIA